MTDDNRDKTIMTDMTNQYHNAPRQPLHRRVFLQSASAVIALPALESMLSAATKTESDGPRRGQAAINGVAKTAGLTATGAPLRMAFMTIPNGVNTKKWRAKQEGDNDAFMLNDSLKSLERHKRNIQMIRGLDLEPATAGNDGGGDHARSNASFLTASRAFKTSGSNIRVGISVDQIAALGMGEKTRIRSLQLGTGSGRKTGSCDSGYSCAYQHNLSWASETQPLAPEANPRVLFEKLFGAGKPHERKSNFEKRQARRKSILDTVLAEAKSMQLALGANDRRKMDEYFNAVRSIEKQIERSERFGMPSTDREMPQGIPENYSQHLRLMFDLLALAFQTDATRIASMPLAFDGSNRNFPEISVSEGHHSLSHHKRSPYKLDQIAKIDRFYCDQFAYFLDKLEAMEDADGRSVLDNAMIVYGSGIQDGDRHSHDDLPIVLAGGGGDTFKRDRAWHAGDVSLGNLYVGMLDRMGVQAEFVGDSTGKMTNL